MKKNCPLCQKPVPCYESEEQAKVYHMECLMNYMRPIQAERERERQCKYAKRVH